MANKVSLVLSHPWVDTAGKVHDVGSQVSVEPSLAERLIAGGSALPASKADAVAAGDPDSPTRRARKARKARKSTTPASAEQPTDTVPADSAETI